MAFLEVKEVIRRVKKCVPEIQIKTDRGKGSHMMLYNPQTGQQYPIPGGGNPKKRIHPGIQKDLVRRFHLPDDTFKQ